jgi:hypothetical protein
MTNGCTLRCSNIWLFKEIEVDLIEYIKSKEQLSIDEAAVILTDIDMKNRSWSAAESYNKVREVHRLGMIERITNRLLACKNEGFIQKISDDDAMNIYGYDGSEEEYMFVKYDRSYIYSDYLIDAIERRNSEASSPECYLPGIICYYLYLNGNTDQEVILKDKIINLYQIYSNIDDDILMAKVKSLLNSKFVKHIGKFINPYIGSNIKQ